MMPPKTPQVLGLRQLTEAEVGSIGPRKASPVVSKIRDSHHLLARLFAMGLGPTEAGKVAGYSTGRASVLRSDPAFAELVEEYRQQITAEWKSDVDEFYAMVEANRNKAARMIADKLEDAEDDPSKISFRDLMTIASDSADRTGYPKRTVAVNVNVDFAARLERAIDRSNKAKAQALGERTGPPVGTGSGPLVIEHEPVKRRA